MAEIVGLIAISVVLLLLLALGVPVAFSLLGSSVVGFLLFLDPAQITVMGPTLFGSVNDSVVAAVPLFILMGELFARSRLSSSTYQSLSGLVGRLPGGLLHSNIAACAVFAAASGSSVGTAAAMGRAATPELNSRGYPRAMTYGSLAAGGTLGILIPPSLALIIYGVLTGTSIGQLFIAGLVPGLLLATLFSAVIVVLAMTWYRDDMPVDAARGVLERLRGIVGLIPLLLVVVLVLGSLYFGIATPTESGAVGVAGMAAVAGIGWKLPWRDVLAALRDAVALTGMILTILMSAALMSYIFAISGIAGRLADAAAAFEGSEFLILLAMGVVFLLLGMFLDPISVLALVLPVAFPISQALGFDPLWFGIFVTVNVELGLITPPIGLNLFILKSVDPTSKWDQVIRGAMPFAAVMVLFLVLLTIVPELATALPDGVR